MLAVALVVAACAGHSQASFCEVAADGLTPLDGDGATERWRALEEAAPPEVESAAQLLRVVADQIERLGPDAEFSVVAALAVTARVATAHRTVVDEVEGGCGLPVPDALELLAGRDPT